MSVGDLTPDLYIPELIKAFHKKPYNVFVSLRESEYNGAALPIQYENVHICRLLPGMSMARRSCVVITRGGQNTMMSCMLAGVPVVGFPGNNAPVLLEQNCQILGKLSKTNICLVMDGEFTRSCEEIIEKIYSRLGRITIRIGVPKKPYSSRICFSKKR